MCRVLMYPSLLSLSLLSVVTSIDGQRRAATFVQEPDNRIVFTNNTGYKIACLASGNPKPSISWYHKSGHQVIDIAGIRHVSVDGSLVFPAFRADDWRLNVHSTSYYCLASNPLGSILSRDVSVRAGESQILLSLVRHFIPAIPIQTLPNIPSSSISGKTCNQFCTRRHVS